AQPVDGLLWTRTDSVAETTQDGETELLAGSDRLEEEIGGMRVRIASNAFFQTNSEMAERLYELAIEFAQPAGTERVFDLYCGIGTIGLLLAGNALTVWGIDVSEESIACALENAELNGIGNVAYFAGNVGQAVEELHGRSGDPDVVVVDPPRAGLAGKALKRLGEIGAPRLVYVSCNPTTLAGDVKRLRADYGYELRRVKPVDMFPHTPHVEAVSLLERS
ncbi:MAG TPA: 23S rRNA (uracil(1939)-C(5))-methyltransferase RlmD, partial [Gaiellaceae bacterium]